MNAEQHKRTRLLIRKAILEELANFSPRALSEETLSDLVAVSMPGRDLDRSDLRHEVNTLVIQDYAVRVFNEDLDRYEWRITDLGLAKYSQLSGS